MFEIKPTDSTPGIRYIENKNLFVFTGISRPSNVREIMQPVLDQMLAILDNKKDINIEFDFFSLDTSSLKMLLIMLQKIKNKLTGKTATVHWKYPYKDIGMREAGKLLEEMSKIDFTFEENPETD